MRRALAPALLVALAAALSGCLQFRTLLRLDADGSGEIEETVLFSDLLRSMVQGDSTSALFDPVALAARADSFGTGVRFVRVDSVAEDGFVGYRAVYAFDDVNTVRLVPPRDASAVGFGGDEGEEAEDGKTSSPFTALAFAYEPGTDGRTGRLRITIPRDPRAGGTPMDSAAVAAKTEELRTQAQEAALLRGFLHGARFAIAVELPGPVTETTARYAEGNVVTLADLELGAYFDLLEEHPEVAARMELAETPEEQAAALRALNEHPGLRFEPEQEVAVRFGE
jgi:hypothetical protein